MDKNQDSVDRVLRSLAFRFKDVDTKAARACLWSLAFIMCKGDVSAVRSKWDNLITEYKFDQNRQAEDLLNGDRFFSTASKRWDEPSAQSCAHNWFGSYWRDKGFVPVMPSGLVLRAQPYGYRPRD